MLIRSAATTLLVLVVLSGSALSSPETDASEALRSRSTTATIHFRTIKRSRGWPGEVNYICKVLEWNGKKTRFRSGYLRNIKPGKHTFKIQWWNKQIPEDAPDDSSYWRTVKRGVTTLTLDVKGGMIYEMKWPYWDDLGGPTGFKA
ncbi:MAG: hypothetical protein QNJ98_14340, partial [Planctomycetota bacterium]|nr:hypothetical protein [Planctomycetota bacterium]